MFTANPVVHSEEDGLDWIVLDWQIRRLCVGFSSGVLSIESEGKTSLVISCFQRGSENLCFRKS